MIEAIILGFVQGLSEFLPISSTGHLLIMEAILKHHQSDAFNVLIQIGSIVAVTVVFRKHIMELLTGWQTPSKRDELLKLAGAFCVTAAGGLIAKKLGLKLPETVVPVAVALVVGAGVIFFVELRNRGRKLSDELTWTIAIAVGLAQVVAAVFPGTSRSGATVMAALLCGLARPAAVRFAFLVGIPTMFAAGALQVKEAIKLGQASELVSTNALVAFAVAAVVSWACVVWLLRFVQSRDFVPFAWYRLALGAGLLGLVASGTLQ